MSYTTSGITDVRIREYDGGVIVRARNGHSDKVVQCYVSGELVDYQQAVAEAVTFHLPGIDGADPIRLLAVDVAEGGTDYWDAAFGDAGGNRIRFQTPQKICPYLPTDRWRVYRGGAGAPEADTKIWEQDFYPQGRRSGGFGFNYGHGGFGWDGHDCKGYGYHWGRGEFGFDCEMLEWETEPLPPGTYPVKVTVLDAAGNESPAAGGTETLDTFARPASGAAVESYDKATDTLTLSFLPSEDLS